MFDSFELNKIVGAVLFSLLVMMGIGIVSDMIYHVETPEEPGYVIEVAEQEATGGEEEQAVPLANLLAQADPARGEDAARKCLACHTFEEGGANKVGPNLHGVVGADIASHQGFAYSEALQGLEGNWTYEGLSEFLASPRQAVPGTAMAFAGIRDDQERADVIVYLKGLSPNAPPLPEPEAAPAETAEGGEAAQQGEAPAEGGEQQGQQQQNGAPEGEQSQQNGAPAEGQQQEQQNAAPAEGEQGQQQNGAPAEGQQQEQQQEATPAEDQQQEQQDGGQQDGSGEEQPAQSQ